MRATPVSDPMNPARSDATQTTAVNSMMFNHALRFETGYDARGVKN
jgi:hypothetical protein